MSRKLVSFNWAIKRLLRSKANFAILEGFLTELLKQDIIILEVLESESNQDYERDKSNQDYERDKSNQDYERDKFNRVDLKVKNSKQELLIIEVQYDSESDYLHRIVYATSKTITEHLNKGEKYRNIVKVIAVNILYFDLGQGEDYVYHGSTRFMGLHQHDELRLSQQQQAVFKKESPSEIFPEFYLIKVNQFNDIAKDSLDEWIYFLKNEEIREDFNAKGLKQAKEALDVMKLSDEERAAYERYVEAERYHHSIASTYYETGHCDGEKVGREKGLKEAELVITQANQKAEQAKQEAEAQRVENERLQALLKQAGILFKDK